MGGQASVSDGAGQVPTVNTGPGQVPRRDDDGRDRQAVHDGPPPAAQSTPVELDVAVAGATPYRTGQVQVVRGQVTEPVDIGGGAVGSTTWSGHSRRS
jgi:hypothetical protein